MIQSSLGNIIADRDFHLAQLERFRRELHNTRNYTQYTLYVHPRKERRYFTLVNNRVEPHTKRYLGTREKTTVQIVQKRRFLEVSIKRIERNLVLMNKFLSEYESLDPYDIRATLPEAYKFTDGACFSLAGAIDVENWVKKKYRRGDMYPQDLKHIDARGEKTRSKSEVIIANALSAHGIPYRIEQPLSIGREYKVPDFIAVSVRFNREIYWEHFGKMADENYRLKYVEKLDFYSRAGVLPGVNLITTYDDKAGNIDARMIELMIQTFF